MGDQQATVMGYPPKGQPLLPTTNTPPPTTATATNNNIGKHPLPRWFELVTYSIFVLFAFIVIYSIASFSSRLNQLFTLFPPKFDVGSLAVDPLIVSSSSSSSSSHLTARWDISLNITNPNISWGDYWFDGVRVSVMYKHAKIASTSMRSFYVGADRYIPNWRLVFSSMGIDSSVADAIAADLRSNGFLSVDIVMDTTALTTWRDDKKKIRKSVKVSCERMMVAYLPRLRMGMKLDGPRSCIVRWW